MGITILNIAAGKFNPIGIDEIKRYFLVNLDTMYYLNETPENVECLYKHWDDDTQTHLNLPGNTTVKCTENAFQFMERTSIQFDRIACYRFLEHVQKTEVLYFIYLMSTCLKIGGEIDCIVPNYTLLAQRILEEDVRSPYFDADDIITTYELLNEPNSPHCSIWTAQRVEYFFALEGRFQIMDIHPVFEFDGRDIYLRFSARRVK